MKKQNILIICGGQSAEHEISILSAKNICNEIDINLFNILIVGITKCGNWYFFDSVKNLPEEITNNIQQDRVALIPESECAWLMNLKTQTKIADINIAFPVMHGPYGEDGAIQGLLKMMDIPYVGPGITASALGMNKVLAKKLWDYAGLKIVPYLVLDHYNTYSYDEIVSTLGEPFFIKPVELGSSVGTHKIHNREEFLPAIEDVFAYDNQVLIEKYIAGQEIECAILGPKHNPQASILGEVKSNHEFYSYYAKYIDENGASLIIPTSLPQERCEQIRQIAIKAFAAIEGSSMARVDFFVTEEEIYINEINTIPGFTNISMYPKLWSYTGIKDKDLINNLIEQAFLKPKKQLKPITHTA